MGSGRTIKVADTSSMKRVKKGVIYGVLMLNLLPFHKSSITVGSGKQ